jgi:hypothetical protein
MMRFQDPSTVGVPTGARGDGLASAGRLGRQQDRMIRVLCHGELVQGISALVVPILPPGRDAIASIAINMTSARLEPERLTELVALLKTEVARIERVINPLEGSGRGIRLAG